MNCTICSYFGDCLMEKNWHKNVGSRTVFQKGKWLKVSQFVITDEGPVCNEFQEIESGKEKIKCKSKLK